MSTESLGVLLFDPRIEFGIPTFTLQIDGCSHCRLPGKPALLSPSILAVAYLDVAYLQRLAKIDYKDEEYLVPGRESLVLIAKDGNRLADNAIIPYLLDSITSQPHHDEGQVNLRFQRFEKTNRQFEAHLPLRTYIVGHSLSLVDIVIWGFLRGSKVAHGLRQSSVNVSRWFDCIQHSNPWIACVVADLISVSQQRKTAASAAGGNFNIGLKNADGNIVTRIPPEPSGYLHCGHAKAALLNVYFAHEYGETRGTLICRFDDTNPSKESLEFQDPILHDLSLLGVTPDRIPHSSDYFDQLYDGRVKLIKDGHAYADDSTKELIMTQRRNGVASFRRNMTIPDRLARFEDMKQGTGLQWCIRAKISPDNPNKALPDPFCIAPTSNRITEQVRRGRYTLHMTSAPPLGFYRRCHACAAHERVSRPKSTIPLDSASARSPDYRNMGLFPPRLYPDSAVKTKTWRVSGQARGLGLGRPRMPAVRGVRRRGMTIHALRQFILEQGPSQNLVNLDWTSFWAINKKRIDPIAPRYTAISKQDAVTAIAHGNGEVAAADKPRHAKNPDLGTKRIIYGNEILVNQSDAQSFKNGEYITLMNWGNAIIRSITTDSLTGTALTMSLDLRLSGDVKRTGKKITWLAKEPGNQVPIGLLQFDYLMAKNKVESGEDVITCLTQQNEFRSEGWADCNSVELAVDDILQLDRIGYFRVDRAFSDGEPAVLFNIPTGKRWFIGFLLLYSASCLYK